LGQRLAEGAGVAAGLGAEAEVEVNLEQPLLEQAVACVEGGVVVASEQGGGP
jgi:hypothetical protein